MKIGKYWFMHFLTKFFYMFFVLFVYAKFTTSGNASHWMNDNISHSFSQILTNSFMIIDFLGGISSSPFGAVLGNLPLMLLVFYCIYRSISRLQLTNKQLFWILLLLSFPIWSSVVSKEAVGVFYIGIICGKLIDILSKSRVKLKFIEIVAFYLLFIFKPQYCIVIGSVFIFIFLCRKLKLEAYEKLFLFVLYIVLLVMALCIFKDVINELNFMMPAYFSLDAGSIRENTIWVNDYDVFFNAPYRMAIGFWGPTLSEINEKPMQSLAFAESVVIVSFFCYFILRLASRTFSAGKINILVLSLTSVVLSWLLFVHYPFGMLKPGNALRYRENFYGFLVVFLFYLYVKYLPRKGDV